LSEYQPGTAKNIELSHPAQPPFLFFQHNQQYDTLLPIPPCMHKLKAGIAYRMKGKKNRQINNIVYKSFIHMPN
jgi:hypothetical protein